MAAIFKYKLHSLGPVLTTLCTLLLHCRPQTYTDSKHYLLFPNWSEFLWKIIAADESWLSEGIPWKSLEFPSLKEACWVWNKTQRMLIIFSAFTELCTNNWFLGVRLSTQSFTVLSWGIQRKWSELSCMSVCHYMPAQSTLKMQEFFGLTTQYLLTACPCSPYLCCIHFWRFKSHWRIQQDTQRHKQKVTWQDMATVLEMVQTFAKLEWEIIIIQTR